MDTHIQLISVAPALVINSPTNPRRRKGLDIDSINEMAESIRANGLMQPILVRPVTLDTMMLWNGQQNGQPYEDKRPAYEIIAGERRWRGAIVADLAAMDALVRTDLNDGQVAEMQLVENIQREQLDPLDEAEGFERLHTQLGYSIAKIASKIAKDKGESYVYKRITLTKLVPAVREALYEEQPLDVSLALLIARYEPEAQPDALDYLRRMKVKGEWPSFRTAKPALAEAFHLVLAHAPFDISAVDLVPAAGSCTACPKRSGNQGDIFGDTNEADSCTDTTCFQDKRDAHVVVLKKRFAKEGFKVIAGAEAVAAKSGALKDSINGYQRLDAVAYTEAGGDGKDRDVTFGDALRGMGKKAPKPRIFIDPHSLESTQVITSELAEKLVPKKEAEAAPATPTKAAKKKAAAAAAIPPKTTPEEDAIGNYHVERAVATRIFDAIRTRPRDLAEMRLIARALFARPDGEACPLRAEQYLGWEADLADQDERDAARIIGEKVDALPIEDLGQAIAMAAVDLFMGSTWSTDQQVLDVAKGYGIDVLAVRDKVAEDLEQRTDAPPAGTEPVVDTSPLTALTGELLQPLIEKVQAAIDAEDAQIGKSKKKQATRKVSLNELEYLRDAQASIDAGDDYEEAIEELRDMVGLADPANGASGDWATCIREELRALLKRLPQREEATA